MKVSDLISVRLSSPLPTEAAYDINAFVLHRAVYIGRSDVNAVIHGQTMFTRTFSVHGRPIDMLCQDACIFYQSVSVLPPALALNAATHPGPIAERLGNGKALLLQNRGGLTASVSQESAVSYFIRLENLCKCQVYAEAAAKGRGEQVIPVGKDEAEFTWEKTGDEAHGWALALPYFARVDRATAGAYKA